MREKSRIGRAKGPIREPVVEPERGGRAISDRDTSDRPVSIKLIIHNSPQIAVTSIDGGIEGSCITQQPVFPSYRITREKFINEFHKEASVLKLKILNPEAAIFFPGLNIFPSHKAFGAVACIFTSPEKGHSLSINGLDNRLQDANSRHKVKR